MSRLEEEEPKVFLMDILRGLSVAQQNSAVQFLPNSMKEVFTESIESSLYSICELAWNYYTTHDVPEEQDKLLRTIIEYHYCKGA